MIIKNNYPIDSILIELMMCMSLKRNEEVLKCLPNIKDTKKGLTQKLKRTGFSMREFIDIAIMCGFDMKLEKGNTVISLSDIVTPTLLETEVKADADSD